MSKFVVWVALHFFCISALCCYGEEKEQKIRIFELLPLMDSLPLVDPFLPNGFELGVQESDPHFQRGYHWGYPSNLREYFSDQFSLTGCIIKTGLSSKVFQWGFDRFSDDQEIVHKLTANGFTEIKLNRGKWGIFPFRELEVKNSKGRKEYQLCIGLNTEDRLVLECHLLYPSYLNEVTQTQKQLWKAFIQKTRLLDLPTLLVAQKMVGNLRNFTLEKEQKFFSFKVEKRKKDQVLLVRPDSGFLYPVRLKILQAKEVIPIRKGKMDAPYVEIFYELSIGRGKKICQVVQATYDLVDAFSFSKEMLSRRTHQDHFFLTRPFTQLSHFAIPFLENEMLRLEQPLVVHSISDAQGTAGFRKLTVEL